MRRRGQADTAQDGIPEQLLGEGTLPLHSESVGQGAEVGKFYVVLGDSLLGYYLVKCLVTNVLDASFSGKYISLSSEKFPDKIMFRETKETDTFKTTTIVSELSVSVEVIGEKQARRFSVNKVELDEILMTISELCDT